MCEEFILDTQYNYYKKEHILSNGQFCEIVFEKIENNKLQSIYEISFCISNNRNYKYVNTQTGKCGLEGLLWAKKQIIKFEKYIINKENGKHIILFCGWKDEKRKNTYYRGLKNI
jgi:hypothetical protein